jgi:uncharacterized protein (DUF1330 family)
MKTHYTIALALVAGVAVGAVVVEGLHAQAKPPAYAINEITITNPDGYQKEFVPAATKILPELAGKFVVRTSKAEGLAGAPPARIVILQFDNIDKLKAWWESPGQKEAQAIGAKYAQFRVYAAEGVTP